MIKIPRSTYVKNARLLRDVPSYKALYAYRPMLIVNAVNSLVRLGKDDAITVIRQYINEASPERAEGVFFVLRVLFNIPRLGYMPEMYVGEFMPRPQIDRRRIPHYPLALFNDIPLLLSFALEGGGRPQPVTEHLEYYSKNCSMRKSPLVPTINKSDVLTRFKSTNQWIYRKDYYPGISDHTAKQYASMGQKMIASQILSVQRHKSK